MILAAWPQLCAAAELKLWIGVFGSEPPPPPSFDIGGVPAQPLAAAPWHPIRDRQVGAAGKPANHQTVVRLAARGPDQPHRIGIAVGGQRIERTVHSLPAAVPATLDGSFNILLSSCYFQPEDAGGLLGTVVSRLPVRPHMTLLAGDQIYGDLPLFEDLPEGDPALTRFLSDKYKRNWLSDTLGVAGLQTSLTRAPAVCLPDDHEFWNNFPFPQAQLPGTWTAGRRALWQAAAQALYEDYQQGGAPGSAPSFWRLDIEPLSLLMLDTRCRRSTDLNAPGGLMAPDAEAAVQQWAADLLSAHAAGTPRIGALAGGQALFVERPGDMDSKLKDAEYGNYAQFAVVIGAFERLAAAGIPSVFITGDVHWGRVAQATWLPSQRPLLYEVICSPSRLIETPGADEKALLADQLRGLFGTRQTWPRHGNAPKPPERFGSNRQFAPVKVFEHRGDQVALISFSRAGRGLEMQVTYHAIHQDAAVARPAPSPRYSLLPM